MDFTEEQRDRVWGIAYRMLGSPDDADDVVQEARLRWLAADRAAIRTPEAWLVSVATRLAIDTLRRAKRERAEYTGPWLPAPARIAADSAPDRDAEMASDLSLAFLHLLERLRPEERAAFLLREVFGVGYGPIADVLERSEASCRQMVRRARLRVREGPRLVEASAAEKADLAGRFVRAIEARSHDELMELLAPEATHLTDGGGRVWAALREIRGADPVARGLLGAARKMSERTRFEQRFGVVNGEPAVLQYADGQLASVSTLVVREGRVIRILTVLNPEKLARAVADARQAGPDDPAALS